MAEYLTKEQKEEIFAKYGKDKNDSGSTEGQIALFTHRIKGLSNHLQTNNKDQSSRRALLSLVGKRKKLLRYMMNRDIVRYRELIKELGIRG